MKYLSLVISSVALILAGIVFLKKDKGAVTENIAGTESTDSTKPLKIAYVDLDSLDANFTFYKNKIEAFEKKKDGLDRQLNNAYQNLDKKRIDFIKKAQTTPITQVEEDSFRKEYEQQMQNLENQRRKSEQDVQQEAMLMRDDIFNKINTYLKDYCKSKGYTYVFSYTRAANIFLYEDPVFDITSDVIAGLNDMYKPEEKK